MCLRLAAEYIGLGTSIDIDFSYYNIVCLLLITLKMTNVLFYIYQGDNGKLELAVVGFTDTFEISPSIVNQDAKFVISVKNNKRLDYEQVRQLNFKVKVT